jgi:hypothetical protein
MRLLHLSDLHLSRYGESGTWTQGDGDDDPWETIQTWQRWRIEGLRDRKGKPDKLRLIDPQGLVHKVKSWPAKKEDRVVGALITRAMKRHQTSTERLIEGMSTGGGGYILAASHTIPPETPDESIFALYEAAGITRQEIMDRAADLRASARRKARSSPEGRREGA